MITSPNVFCILLNFCSLYIAMQTPYSKVIQCNDSATLRYEKEVDSLIGLSIPDGGLVVVAK